MKATLIFPPAFLPWRLVGGAIPLGVHILGTLLRRNGIDAQVLDQYAFGDLVVDPRKEVTVGSLTAHAAFRAAVERADVLGLSCDSFNYGIGVVMIRAARELNRDLRICVGGVHATLLDDVVATHSGADVVVRGEGEARVVSIMSAMLDRSGYEAIPGVTYLDSTGSVARTDDAPYLPVEELSDMNQVDYERISSLQQATILPVETSRGCLFRCRFCSVPHKGTRRLLPVDSCMRSFEAAVKKKQDIVLTDDCFTSERERAQEILSFINRHDCTVTYEARASDIDKCDGRIFESISATKIRRVQVGVECGYQAGLRAIRKGISIRQVEKACELAERNGVPLMMTFIIGFPWEGRDECLATINFAERLRNAYGVYSVVNWWIPCPSELLYENKEELAVDLRMYENPSWPLSKDVFSASHPAITPSMRRRIDYLRMAKNIA